MKIGHCLAGLIWLMLLISGCNRKSYIVGIDISKENIGSIPAVVKLNVVYIPQNDNKSCATTSAAMAISYYADLRKPLDKEVVWKISGTDENTIYQYGNDMGGLKRIAEYFGYKSEYADNMAIHDIEFLLSKGILVVLNIRMNETGSATHAVLATGYDNSKKILYINDPATIDRKFFKYSDLEKRWSAILSSPMGMSYRSGFIIYPKCIESEKNGLKPLLQI
jgi:hypothetical protein